MESSNEKIKYEVVDELGLLDQVRKYGWKSLSPKQTGKIGGLITKKKRMMKEGKSHRI